jgi:hypothetical protein
MTFPSPEVTRRTAIQRSLAFASAFLLPPSLFAESGSPQPTPTGPTAQAQLTITPNGAGHIGSGFIGLSYEKSNLASRLFSASNRNLIALFRRLGTGVLRIGGNSADQSVWAANGLGKTPSQIAPSDVAALADFVKATGWRCLYGINLGGALSHAPATTPDLAAAEVAYVSSAFGSSLLGIEIGNETDIYSGTMLKGGKWTLPQFEVLWAQFRSAIASRAPGVAVTGPASAGNEAPWTVAFGQWATKSRLSLLTQHYYRGDAHSPDATAANLVNVDPRLGYYLSVLRAGSSKIGIPFRFTECNSYYNGGADGVSNAYCSTLWMIDFLFTCAVGGAQGVNLHGGGHSDGYTPIADSGGYVHEVRPEYYGLLLFALAGQGSLYATSLAGTAGMNVTAYAVRTSSGMNLVVVNKEKRNLHLSARLPQNASSASLLELTQSTGGTAMPSLSATSGVKIQDASVAANGAFSPGAPFNLRPAGQQLPFFVPALSAVLVRIS